MFHIVSFEFGKSFGHLMEEVRQLLQLADSAEFSFSYEHHRASPKVQQSGLLELELGAPDWPGAFCIIFLVRRLSSFMAMQQAWSSYV